MALALLLAVAGCHAGEDPAPPPAEPSLDREIEAAALELSSGDIGGARADLERILSRRPENARARFYLGLTYYREQRHDRAAKLFEQSLGAGASFKEAGTAAHFQGWSLFHLGRLDEARKAFESHLRSAPGSADSLAGLGRIAWEEGRLEDAEELLGRALESERATLGRRAHVAKYLVQLADVHIRQGRSEQALAELNDAARKQPGAYSIHYKLYRLYSERGEGRRAAEAYRRYESTWSRMAAGREGG